MFFNQELYITDLALLPVNVYSGSFSLTVSTWLLHILSVAFLLALDS